MICILYYSMLYSSFTALKIFYNACSSLNSLTPSNVSFFKLLNLWQFVVATIEKIIQVPSILKGSVGTYSLLLSSILLFFIYLFIIYLFMFFVGLARKFKVNLINQLKLSQNIFK